MTVAHYGCTYSVHRFYPNEEGASVVYNNVIESFTIKPHIPAQHCEPGDHTVPTECDTSTLTDQGHDKLNTSSSDCVNKVPDNPTFHKEMTPEIITSKNFDSTVMVKETSSLPNSSSVTSPVVNTSSENGHSILTRLPVEVLHVVACHLDSQSLANLAVTCKLLRDIACSLLEEKGIVVFNWEKQQVEEQRPKWRVTHKVCMLFVY